MNSRKCSPEFPTGSSGTMVDTADAGPTRPRTACPVRWMRLGAHHGRPPRWTWSPDTPHVGARHARTGNGVCQSNTICAARGLRQVSTHACRGCEARRGVRCGRCVCSNCRDHLSIWTGCSARRSRRMAAPRCCQSAALRRCQPPHALWWRVSSGGAALRPHAARNRGIWRERLSATARLGRYGRHGARSGWALGCTGD